MEEKCKGLEKLTLLNINLQKVKKRFKTRKTNWIIKTCAVKENKYSN